MREAERDIWNAILQHIAVSIKSEFSGRPISRTIPIDLFKWTVLSLRKGLDVSKALVHERVQTFEEKSVWWSWIPSREFKHDSKYELRVGH
jgi:hypothetical protein